MKKICRWLLTAVMTIIILTLPGCRLGGASVTPTSTAFPTSSDVPSPTLSPTATLSPTPSLSPTPTLPPREALLQNAEKTVGGDLYRLRFSVEDDRKSHSYRFFNTQNGLLSVDWLLKGHSENPVSVVPKTGEIISISEDFAPAKSGTIGLADKNTIYVVNASKNEWKLYNLSFNEIVTFTLEDGSFELENSYYIDGRRHKVFYPGGIDTLCFYDYETESLSKVRVPDGIIGLQKIAPLGENMLGVYGTIDVSESGEEADFRPCIARFDYSTKSFTDYIVTDASEMYMSPDNGECFIVLESPYVKAGLYDVASGTFKSTIKMSDTEEAEHVCIDWINRCFITYSFATASETAYEELRCYSIDTGELTASAVVPEKAYGFAVPDISEDLGILCIYGTEEVPAAQGSEAYIYYWDYLGGNADGSKEYFDHLHTLSNRLRNYTETLENKYGIYFYLGHEVLVSDFAYELEVCTDDDLMYRALQKIEKVLDSYPQNFFKQIKTGNARTLGIYLCQGLVEKEEGLASDAIAFASAVGYERSIAFDVRYEKELMRTVYHEISHWIDTYIEEMNKFGICTDYEEGWNALNPEGYSYLDSYKNYGSKTEYTYFAEKDYDNVYFIDTYSNTTSGEDRARLFEYLMEDDAQNFYKCTHLIEKLEYRFAVIRKAFDTTGWPEKTSWEEKLEGWKSRNREE